MDQHTEEPPGCTFDPKFDHTSMLTSKGDVSKHMISLRKNTSSMTQGVEVGRKRLSKIDQKMEAKMECILASVLSSILDLKICQNPSNNRLIFFFDGCLDRFFVHFGSTWGVQVGVPNRRTCPSGLPCLARVVSVVCVVFDV